MSPEVRKESSFVIMICSSDGNHIGVSRWIGKSVGTVVPRRGYENNPSFVRFVNDLFKRLTLVASAPTGVDHPGAVVDRIMNGGNDLVHIALAELIESFES